MRKKFSSDFFNQLLLLICFIFMSATEKKSIGNELESKPIKIRVLLPTDFKELNKMELRKLRTMGCQIPQYFDSPLPSNVIVGDFSGFGQKDKAVLCRKKDKSSIVILWDGKHACKDQLATYADAYSLSLGAGQWIFMRKIETQKASNHNQKGDSIFDQISEGASKLYLCKHGKWTEEQQGD